MPDRIPIGITSIWTLRVFVLCGLLYVRLQKFRCRLLTQFTKGSVKFEVLLKFVALHKFKKTSISDSRRCAMKKASVTIPDTK